MSKVDSLYPALQRREAYMSQLGERAKTLYQDQLKGVDNGAEFSEVLRRQAITQMGSKVLIGLALKPSKIVTDEAR